MNMIDEDEEEGDWRNVKIVWCWWYNIRSSRYALSNDCRFEKNIHMVNIK